MRHHLKKRLKNLKIIALKNCCSATTTKGFDVPRLQNFSLGLLLCGSFKLAQGQFFFLRIAFKNKFFNISAKIFDVF